MPLRVALPALQDELIQQAAQRESMDISPWAKGILFKAAQERIDASLKRKAKGK